MNLSLLFLASLTLGPLLGQVQNYRVETVIGRGNDVGDGQPALQARLRTPNSVAFDRDGRLLIADRLHHRIRRLETDGTLSTIAGTGFRGVRGDDGLARDAELWEPNAIAVNREGVILIADGSSRIRAITPDGRINTIAGNGRNGFSGDGGPALQASIGIPGGIAVDGAGNFYFSEILQARVRRVSPDGIITTVAGNGEGGFSGDGGPATAASLFVPLGLAISPGGTLLIADSGNLRVREVLANGTIRTFAGGGQGGDGGPANQAFLGNPCAVAADQQGNLFIGEFGSRIRLVKPGGSITTLASAEEPQGGQATPIPFSLNANPCGLTVNAEGALLVARGGDDVVSQIAVKAEPWQETRLAGAGAEDITTLAPREATLFSPQGLAWDGASLLFTDAEAQRVYRFQADRLSVVAGNGTPGFSGDNGPASAAALTAPAAVAVAADGRVWVADSLNRRIRLVSPDGTITTLASADAPLAENRIGVPLEIVADPAGNLYFTEVGRPTVKKLDPAGRVTVFAGSDTPGAGGDGGPATRARLNNPVGLALDAEGNLYIADSGNLALRRVSPAGIISTVARQLRNPTHLALDGEGRILLAEVVNENQAGIIRRLESNGSLTLLAGNELADPSGDGGLATRAGIGLIGSLRATPDGAIWFTDSSNRTVRRLLPLSPSSLQIVGGDQQTSFAGAAFAQPLAVAAVSASGLPLSGLRIAFRLASGKAELGAETALTDANGIALLPLVAGSEAGTVEVDATLLNSTIGTVRFTLQTVAPPPAAPPLDPASLHISTLAGNASAANANALFLLEPAGFSRDGAGNYYLSDAGLNRILRIDGDGNCTVVLGLAGGGFCPHARANPVAIQAPAGLLVTSAGDLLFAETTAHRVRKLSPTGELSVFAGTGRAGFTGDEGPATAARLNMPTHLAEGTGGVIFISDTSNRRVRKVSPDGTIDTFAGSGIQGAGGDGAPAREAPLASPQGLAYSSEGILYIADTAAHQVKGVSAEGVLFIAAGTGEPPSAASGDAEEAADEDAALPAELDTPVSVALGQDGTLYIAETGRIRILAPKAAPSALPERGLGSHLLLASFASRLFVLDADRAELRRLEPSGILSTLLGGRFSGDGGPALAASLGSPDGLVYDAQGNLYVADTQNNRIRRILSDGTIETYAGNGNPQSNGDGGPALSAGLDGPAGLALAPDGTLFVAESRGARVRRISPDGIITTYAGSGRLGTRGDEGPARNAAFLVPYGLALDKQGNLFVSDFLANTIRVISPTGIIRRYAGTGRLNRLALNPRVSLRALETDLQGPSGLALDAQGNLLVADKLNHRVWSVLPSGAILPVAGTGRRRAGPDGVPATESDLNRPSAVAVDSAGAIYISEEGNRIRLVQPSGTAYTGLVFTLAGRGPAGFGGDDGPAARANLNNPGPLTFSPTGDLVFSDRGNRRIRRLFIP
ncbi:MAG: hypothetical protein NW208_05600 [Bryobacter sp.]|nr:hypothetical protein [Bryobacter sp.]